MPATVEIVGQYLEPREPYEPLADYPGDPNELYAHSLTEGTFLAGREKPFVWEVDQYTSEGALHRYRAIVEIEGLINLAERGPLDISITEEEKETLRTLYSPEVFDANRCLQLDHGIFKQDDDGKWARSTDHPALEHDVKAVETYIDELLDSHDLGRLKEWVHFGRTSEDVNNLAFNFMLRDVTNEVVIPAVGRVADRLAHFAAKYADTPTVGITHAQKASPTTAGKQFAYFLSNVTEVMNELEGLRLTGKYSGAVGNHNPETVLMPDFDQEAYARDFVESFGFNYASVQNQRNNHLAVTNLLDKVTRLAVVGKDVTDNVWLKILGNQLVQKLVEGEKGSSTMSHKINPWRLEETESLYEQMLGLTSRATEGLVESRHERDLSDHGWQRAYGDMIGRVVAGFNYFAVQMDRLMLNEDAVQESLEESWEVLSELIQTAGRVSGDPEAYNKVVRETQGKKLDEQSIREIIHAALPDGIIKDRVLEVKPATYTGIAEQEAHEAVLGWHAANLIFKRGLLDESTSIDAVLLDLDGTLHFGDKDELHARLSAIASELRSEFTDEELREFGNRSDFQEMKTMMVAEHNRRFPDNQITPEEFLEINDGVSGSFDHMFYTADAALTTIEQLRESGKKTGLVTTRGNKSRDRLLNLHGFTDSFDVIVGRGDCEKRKPHPQPIALALERLGIEDPRRTMYVGDLQYDDVGAGNALRMKTALVNKDPLDPYGPIPTHHWPDLKPLARLYGR